MAGLEFSKLPNAGIPTLENREKKELIMNKWGLGYLKADTYSFNGSLPQVFDPQEFFLNFFKVQGTASEKVESIELSQLTTNVIGPSIWQKLYTPPYRITSDSVGHAIIKCPDRNVRGIWISDCLQSALIDEDSAEYGVFTPEDRRELIFVIMRMLVIGGEICQYEDDWDVYEPVVTSLYRDLIGQSVVKAASGSINIVAHSYLLKKVNGKDICADPDRSFCVLVIDTLGKKVHCLQFLARL